jgi:hypothetical protein
LSAAGRRPCFPRAPLAPVACGDRVAQHLARDTFSGPSIAVAANLRLIVLVCLPFQTKADFIKPLVPHLCGPLSRGRDLTLTLESDCGCWSGPSPLETAKIVSIVGCMGYNARNDEIRDNITRMRREWEAQRNSLATVRRFNATLSAKGYIWFWPKIAAALTSKHHWLVITCDSCGTVVDLDLRVKPRDPEASIRVAIRDVQCPRCNGYGRPRIIALARHPSI